MRKFVTFLYTIYNKYQMVLLTVFVLGLLDVLAYTDLVAALFAMPEFAPVVITVLIVIGIARYFYKKRKK